MESVDARHGIKLLDVATGTGILAGIAVKKGIDVTGIDYASFMITVSRRNYPQAQFAIDDAESLSLEDSSFDAVTCQFGLNHMADPDAAIAESYRVLKSGGKYGFTVWNPPDGAKFFEFVLGAIQTHGTLNVPLPPAPPIFRLSDHDECKRVLESCGFTNVHTTNISMVSEAETPQEVLDAVYNVAVRPVMILKAQTAEALKKIHESILEGAIKYESGSSVKIPMSATLACAEKP